MSLQFSLPFPIAPRKVQKYTAQAQAAVFCPFVRYLKSYLRTVIILLAKITPNSGNYFFCFVFC